MLIRGTQMGKPWAQLYAAERSVVTENWKTSEEVQGMSILLRSTQISPFIETILVTVEMCIE